MPSSPSPERSPHQYFAPPPQTLLTQHMLSTSPYSNSPYSYPAVSSPPYMAQPQPIPYGSPSHSYAHSQQPQPHLYQHQPVPHLRARSVSPPRSRGISPAPAYHQATAPSPSTSYGRTVTPTLGRQTSPSPGSSHRPQNTPYPRPQAPLSFTPSSRSISHQTRSDDGEDGETQITESGVSPVAYAGLATRRPYTPTAFSDSSRGTRQTGHVMPTPPPEGSSRSHSTSSLPSSSPRSRATNHTT